MGEDVEGSEEEGEGGDGKAPTPWIVTRPTVQRMRVKALKGCKIKGSQRKQLSKSVLSVDNYTARQVKDSMTGQRPDDYSSLDFMKVMATAIELDANERLCDKLKLIVHHLTGLVYTNALTDAVEVYLKEIKADDPALRKRKERRDAARKVEELQQKLEAAQRRLEAAQAAEQ